jgi:hypothetical protein
MYHELTAEQIAQVQALLGIDKLIERDPDGRYTPPCGWSEYCNLAVSYGYHVIEENDTIRPTTAEERRARLLDKHGWPKEILILDNGGKTWDRYTVIYTGPCTHLTGGVAMYVGMSTRPFDPQGFGQHGELPGLYDLEDEHLMENVGHMGRRIKKFTTLPEDCQRLVMADYLEMWDIEKEKVGA